MEESRMGKKAPKEVFEMKNICKNVVGIVGGMGAYATLHFFRKLLDAFDVEKEWERPRVIIDNNTVMPSRVRAILYGERREQLVEMLADSIRRLLTYNADTIVLACNTSHHFLPEIRQKVSIPDDVLVDLVETVTDHLRDARISDIFVIATEGTIATRVYDGYCLKHGVAVSYPERKEDQKVLREFIESVKQQKWEGLTKRFGDYLANLDYENVVLGCTELPMIFDAIADKEGLGKNIIDPVQLTVHKVHSRITGSCK